MRLLVVAALAACMCASAAVAATAPLMTVLIKPSRMDGVAGKGDVEVTLTVPGMDVAAGAPLFALPAGAPGMSGPQPVEDLTIRDAEGLVPLNPRDTGGMRPWTATRRVRGEVVARYRLPIDNVRGSTPPIVLRVDGDSFSTPGRMLVAIPQGSTPYRVAIRWDVSAMAPGSVGVSGYGDGDVEIPAGPAGRLSSTMFMAGRFQREPDRPSTGFQALWGGEPTFDPRPLMQWTGKLHAWMSRFFRDEVEPPYRVVLRSNPLNPGGGVAMTQSFAVGYWTGTNPEALKSILGHEMTHTWTAIEPLGKWYSEGNAVYYQGLLPWRAGLITTEQYLADLNKTASRYYTNTKKATPEAQVLDQFWDDTRVRVLPYDRGALYFAVLNGKVRRASGGKRSIDDLIRTMIGRVRSGAPVTEAVWLDVLRAEIGEAGPATHHAMMSGGLMLPESGDFGPCFRRVVRKIRVFEPGFDLKAIAGPDKVIRGLVPGSEAARAGLRDGDKVLSAPLGDAVQADVTRRITARVARGGETLSITYLPRGEAVDAYQWARVPDVPESACKV